MRQRVVNGGKQLSTGEHGRGGEAHPDQVGVVHDLCVIHGVGDVEKSPLLDVWTQVRRT